MCRLKPAYANITISAIFQAISVYHAICKRFYLKRLQSAVTKVKEAQPLILDQGYHWLHSRNETSFRTGFINTGFLSVLVYLMLLMQAYYGTVNESGRILFSPWHSKDSVANWTSLLLNSFIYIYKNIVSVCVSVCLPISLQFIALTYFNVLMFSIISYCFF